MQIEFSRQFYKDLDKITLSHVKNSILQIIGDINAAKDTSEIKNLKKLKGHSHAWRIRSGNYRLGIFIEDDIIEIVRIAHRKDIQIIPLAPIFSNGILSNKT